jgi:hypothetical protein
MVSLYFKHVAKLCDTHTGKTITPIPSRLFLVHSSSHPKQHPDHLLFLITLSLWSLRLILVMRNQTPMREEEPLDGNRIPSMQHNNHNEQDLRSLDISSAKDGVQIAEEEESGGGETDSDEYVVENCSRI